MARTTSKDSRPRVEASAGIKARFVDLKSSLKLKTDADVIAYLIALHDEKISSVTLPQDAAFRKKANDINDQGVM
ncbi:hypothetical protein [Paenibacillus agricola]|uniref:Uncharacterized protein n=1 Tax=Paenibacillus agricola TaxID=2716264 RepID=A0ABX0JI70_9BACL|nr:hypothetical protein [Paenibacillus agricola]NHN35556.1 hypothetical protein [Paenibacillus agricola]